MFFSSELNLCIRVVICLSLLSLSLKQSWLFSLDIFIVFKELLIVFYELLIVFNSFWLDILSFSFTLKDKFDWLMFLILFNRLLFPFSIELLLQFLHVL